jgi:hypothetical protein
MLQVDLPFSHTQNVNYHLAKRKLEELFLKWLVQSSTSKIVGKLIEDCQKPNPNLLVNQTILLPQIGIINFDHLICTLLYVKFDLYAARVLLRLYS